MRSHHVLPLAALLNAVLLLAAPPAQAQQDPDLPNIAPREVEIRGRLDVSLPALRRPALSGLLPEAQIEPLPPLAPPSVANVEAPGPADGGTLPGDAGPDASGLADAPPPESALLEVGGGRYFSRFARARYDAPLAPAWAVRARLDYDGTDGFAPFDNEPGAETPADALRGRATLRTEQPAFTAAFTADGALAGHRLYGATGTAVAGGLRSAPEREHYGGGAGVHVEGGSPRLPFEARARYDGAQVRTTLYENGQDDMDRAEQRFAGALHIAPSVNGLRAEADVRGATARLSGSAGGDTPSPEGTVSFLDAGTGLQLADGDPVRVFAGARLLTFAGEAASGTYVAPDVRLRWQAAPRLSLYARTTPGIEANPLTGRYRENPSLFYEEAPQPTVRSVDAEGGAHFFPVQALELRAFAGYRRAPSHRFYEDAASTISGGTLYRQGLTAARYAEARVLRAGGAVSWRHAEALHASLSLAVRNGRLTEADAEIPYFSPVLAEALLAYGFASGDGRIALTSTFESARPARRSDVGEVGAFFDLDLEGTYALTPDIGLTLHLQNVVPGALERYDRYPRPPLVFEGGLRVRL